MPGDNDKETEINHTKKMIKLLADLMEGKAVEGYKNLEIETETGKRKIETMDLREVFKVRESYLAKLSALSGAKKKRAIIGPKF